jgi:hypothetical protein
VCHPLNEESEVQCFAPAISLSVQTILGFHSWERLNTRRIGVPDWIRTLHRRSFALGFSAFSLTLQRTTSLAAIPTMSCVGHRWLNMGC